MDKANAHPASDQRHLALAYRVEQTQIGVGRTEQRRIVAGQGVFGETLQLRVLAARGEVFEGADPQVAGRDTGEQGAG